MKLGSKLLELENYKSKIKKNIKTDTQKDKYIDRLYTYKLKGVLRELLLQLLG